MYAKLLDEMRHAKACGLSFKVTTESGSRYVFTPRTSCTCRAEHCGAGCTREQGWLYSRIPAATAVEVRSTAAADGHRPDLVGHLVSRETDAIRVSPSNGRLYVDDIVSTPIMAVEVLG